MSLSCLAWIVIAVVAASCGGGRGEPRPPALDGSSAGARYDALSRSDFNRLAQERFQPLFWRSDANHNRTLDPDELAVLIGPWHRARRDFVGEQGFTADFARAYHTLTRPDAAGALSESEARRRRLVLAELAQGTAVLVETDLSSASAGEQALFDRLVAVAGMIERLYALQRGTTGMFDQIPAADLASRALFHRNQSPYCIAPKTESEPACSALPITPPRVVGLYPAALQRDPAFCDALAAQDQRLLAPFSVVVADGQGLRAVPYHERWATEMAQVAAALDEAAAAIEPGTEAALRRYLLAAAHGFRTNDWEPADAAWVAMGSLESAWYLRVGPDEVYREPCARKAAFAFQLGRINRGALVWKQKLAPVMKELEDMLAAFAGPPYQARQLGFKLPDFVDVTLNAGEQRHPVGATVGQSLPNWGPLAERGGRTVVMTNLYTDADSRSTLRGQLASVLCRPTFDLVPAGAEPTQISVILHEAAHNLGPANDHRVDGKTSAEIFGGPLAATLEELKAHVSALHFTWWLQQRGLVTEEEATRATVRDLGWAFGHISRGMRDGTGNLRPYGLLASIHLGAAMRAGALTWSPATAANGVDRGCLQLDLAAWKQVMPQLARRVARIKSIGDRAGAAQLQAELVDADDAWAKQRAVIAERWLRAPRATFVYSVKR